MPNRLSKEKACKEIYGVWPKTTTDGLKAMKELNNVTKAILRAKAV